LLIGEREMMEDEKVIKTIISSKTTEISNKDSIKLENLHPADKFLIKGFMRGFGKTIVLWHISKKKMHGYEIMTNLNELSGNRNMPGPSKIYPMLHDLEENGLIKGTWKTQGKKKLKNYEITEKGIETLIIVRKVIKNRILRILDEFVNDKDLNHK
jgi:PadR family transcriptional regulator